MPALTIHFFLITALLTLASCGGGKGNSVSLDVSTSFSVADGTGFDGGLIAYGEKDDGKKFSASAVSGQDLKVNLVDGKWKIYVVGYENQSKNLFRGTRACGSTEVNLTSSTSKIDIKINAANCDSTQLLSDLSVREVKVLSCKAFYVSSADAFYPLSDASTDGFCGALPHGFNAEDPYYKVFALNDDGTTKTAGISTECLPTSSSSQLTLILPTAKIPLSVQTFRSLADCEANAPRPIGNKFDFITGLKTGDPDSFDSLLQVKSSGVARLVLPTAKTRRGFSPFMNILPSFNCSATGGDCFGSVTAPTLAMSGVADFDVPWSSYESNNNNSPVILRGFASSRTSQNTCPTNIVSLLNSKSQFSFENCRIENGNLRGDFKRNPFYCGSTGINSILDIQEGADRIYVTSATGQGPFLNILDLKGVTKNTLYINSLGSATIFESLTSNAAGDLLIKTRDQSQSNHLLTLYRRIPGTDNFSAPVNYPSTTYPFITDIKQVAFLDTNRFISTLKHTSNVDRVAKFDLSSLTASTGNALPLLSGEFRQNSIKTLVKNNVAYILAASDIQTNLYAYDYSESVPMITNLGNPIQTVSGNLAGFHVGQIGGARYLILFPAFAAGSMTIMPLSNSNVTSPALSQAYTLPYISTGGILTGDHALVIANGVLNPWKINPSSTAAFSEINPATSNCEAQIAGTIGTKSYDISLMSNSGINTRNIFDNAFRFIGADRVSSPKVLTYFPSLQEDDDDNLGRASGILNNAQDMMGPDGVGGVMSNVFRGMNCSDIKAQVSATPKSGTFRLTDPIEDQSRTYSYAISGSTLEKELFVRNGQNAADVSPYDLIIKIASSEEKITLKIDCSSRLGSLENLEVKDGLNRREALFWNTHSDTEARYERFQYEPDDSNRLRLSWTIAQKSTLDNLAVRNLELEKNATQKSGRIVEMHRSEGMIYNAEQSTNSIPSANFLPTNTTLGSPNGGTAVTVGEIISSLGISANGSAICMSSTNSDPLVAPYQCDPPSSPASMQHSAIDPNITTSLEYLNANEAEFLSVFKLTP